MTVTAEARTAADVRPGTRSATDAWVWFAVIVGGLFWAGTARPLGDPDIWWHVRTGQLILDSGIPDREPWAFTAQGREWVPTAWLSDVILAGIHELLGWRGIVLFKVVVSGALLLLLARQLFSLASSRIAAPLFTLVAITLSPFLAERPQLISLLLTVWLVGTVKRAFDGHLPPWWTIAVAYVWANLHGMWILVPLSLGVAAVGLALDRRDRWRTASLRALMLAIGSTAAAALTPVGPELAYWALVVRDAASDISEWQPTVLVDRYSFAFTLLFLLWVLAVARSSVQAPRSELLWMSSVFLFSLQAGRNVAPAIILMAPFVCVALNRAYGDRLKAINVIRVPRWIMGTTVALAVIATSAMALSGPALVDGIPLRIVDRLEERPGTVNVLNSYNVGGVLTGFGAPGISVAIDGRTDNYDPAFVHRYLAATTKLVEWRKIVREVDADVAVLGKGGTLANELKRSGWRQVMVDGDFVLLEAPA